MGNGGNGEDALGLAREHLVDVLLTDLSMPIMDGLTAIHAVKREYPSVEICVLTVHDDDQHLFEALKAGAKGYLLKDSTLDEIVGAVRSVARGEAAIPPALALRVIEEFKRISRQKAAIQQLFSELTRREVETLKLLAESKTNRQTADELFLSLKTVKTHVGNVLRKLEVNSRTEAAILAVRSGLEG